jgi:hypothetical protein
MHGLTLYFKTISNTILDGSKDILEYIQSRSLSSCNSIKTFDFSTLYTTIPHPKLRQIKRISPTVFHIKRMANVNTTLATNPVINHELRKDREVIEIGGSYPGHL